MSTSAWNGTVQVEVVLHLLIFETLRDGISLTDDAYVVVTEGIICGLFIHWLKNIKKGNPKMVNIFISKKEQNLLGIQQYHEANVWSASSMLKLTGTKSTALEYLRCTLPAKA